MGVSDSKSLVIASDVEKKELDDNVLTEICRAKLDGSSLSKLTGVGKFFPCFFVYQTRADFLFIFL